MVSRQPDTARRNESRMVLPSGDVTFLFSDVEGSTQLLERHPDAMGAALGRHHELFEAIVPRHRGVIFETIGDAVYAAFNDPVDAVAAALAVQRDLAVEDWGEVERLACRLAIHGGPVVRRGDHYFGPALFRCARLQSIGYGEQVLLSGPTAERTAPRLPQGVVLRDLGEHRLKDLAEPEHVFMLVHPDLRESFPPLKSVDTHPHNLPAQLAEIIGREKEIDQVRTTLASSPLVVLTGPGGIGKTRLALAVAHAEVEDQPNGTFFVDLAEVREADALVAATADMLGVPGQPGIDRALLLGSFLADRPMLLVLDNVEQIRRAGRVLRSLVDRAPAVRLLVTSRTPLGVKGERVIPVPPLAARHGNAGGMGSGSRLFIESAHRWNPTSLTNASMDAVADIVEQVDGLPLAIELAAARTRLFSPQKLLSRLTKRLDLLADAGGEGPERHRTLRATITWSYDLLGDGEQRAFRHAAVFVGGFTVDAALEVLETDLDGLSRLVDAGLVTRSGSRLRMLETIREFAAELFESDAEHHAVSQRHATWCLSWLTELLSLRPPWPLVHPTPEQQATISAEHQNLSAAIEWYLSAERQREAMVMALGLWSYWLASGFTVRAEDWLDRAMALPPTLDDELMSIILGLYGEFPRFRGNVKKAIALKERSLALSRRANPSIVAPILHDLTSLWGQEGDIERARAVGEEGLRLRIESGRPIGIAHALEGLGDAELNAGDPERALDYYRRGFDEFKRALTATPAGIGAADAAALLEGIAISATRAGDSQSALNALEQRFEVAAPDMPSIAGLVEGAAIVMETGDPAVVAELLGFYELHRQRTGFVAYYPALLEEVQASLRLALGHESFEAAGARGAALSDEAAVRLAEDALRRLRAGASVDERSD
jgi:predicted ATPase/class 3 adenylate cyclase/tetratricopeptide (TPR) repeat protein